MTCFALGIIISVTKKMKKLRKRTQTRGSTSKLIDAELDAEKEVEEDYSIVDKAANPMNAVINNIFKG
jgi:cell division protein FtsW